MTLNFKTIAATAVILGGAAAAAVAANGAAGAENDALALGTAKISLSQAVTAAEAKVQGKAAKAEFEQAKGGKWVFDVEVVAGNKVFDVAVDADTGAVLTATEDKADHDDDNDKKD
jgi:uncharacterized membrane protein YkoI